MSLFPNQDAFSRGEVSPRLHARASIDLYRAGLSRCENFFTMPHGGLRKRGGTYFVSEVIDSTKTHRLIPFIFSDDQAYALLIGDGKLWVFAYSARVGTVEVTTPWDHTDLAALQFVGSKDQLWITHPSYKTRVLTRTAHTTWKLSILDPNDGPYDAVNTVEADEMYVSAVTGSIIVTADFDAFVAADVGRLIRIEMDSFRTIPPWEADQIVAISETPVGKLRRFNGNVYTCTTPFNGSFTHYRTGATPPTHTVGIEKDGPGIGADEGGPNVYRGLDWQFLHPGFGVARITAFTDATVVTATVLTRFPAELVGSANKSFVWRFGALHTADYGSAVTIFEERIGIGVGNAVYASKSFEFDKFRPGPEDNDALQFLIVGDDVAWLADADGTLAVGTIGGVKALSGSGLDEALTPSSFKNRKSRTHSCAPLMPVDTGTSFIYINKSRKLLVEMMMNQIGKFQTEDLMQISEHIPKRGVISLAFQNNPDPILWFPLDTGELGGFTHQPSQEVRGAHRHKLGGSFSTTPWGIVESCCVTPGQTGIDDVWLVVKRTVNGNTVRYLETMQAAFEYGSLADAFCVDCGLTYTGAAVSMLTGLTHLQGQAVWVLSNGVVYKTNDAGAPLLVGNTGFGGELQLPTGVTTTKAHVGLPYGAYADSLELDVGGRDGSLRGRPKRITGLILSLLESDRTGLEVSSLLKGIWEPARIATNVAADNTVASLYTGNVGPIALDDSWSGEARYSIRHLNPTPLTIRAVTPQFDGAP